MKPWYLTMKFWNKFAGPFNLYCGCIGLCIGNYVLAIFCLLLAMSNYKYYWYNKKNE